MSEALSVLTFSTSIAEQEAPQPLPVGEYDATIDKAEAGTSRSSGNPMLILTFRVAPEDYPPDYEAENAPDGTPLTLYITATDDARSRYRMRKICEALGVAATTEVDPNEFMGLTGKITVEHEEYEGEMRARLKSVAAN